MSLKKQLMKLKDNWLVIVLFVFGFLLMFFFVAGSSMRSFNGIETASYSKGYVQDMRYGGSYYPSQDDGLAPNILDRIIIKTASMNVIVKDWAKSESELKSYIKSNDAILTNENVNTQYSKYKNGYYTINVPTDKYDALVSQLKNIGDVQSFSENANDITGSYVRLQDIISAEKDKLYSYEKIYNSTSNTDDKIKLMDRIYSEKNTIAGLENQLQNQNERIDYSQISFTMQEKTPVHANVVFASLADLWSSFKQSLNVMLYLIAYVLPFILLWLLIWGIVRLIKRN